MEIRISDPAFFVAEGARVPVARPEQSLDSIRTRLSSLLRERDELRRAALGRAGLEENRRAIGECQWELARALVADHARRHDTNAGEVIR